MCPRVMIFSDRLEIESPGMLPFGYTFDDFVSGVSHVRNRVIARVFRELHLMEEWGTGYRRITEASRKGGYINPQWKEIGTTIRVTFRPHLATQEERVKKTPTELTSRQLQIKKICEENGPLSSKEIYSELRNEISERMLRNDLLNLKQLGYLETIGSGPKTKWAICSDRLKADHRESQC